MLLLFLHWVATLFHWKIPSAFDYISTRMLLSALTSLLMTIFLGPRLIKKLYELKIGQPIRSVQEVPLLAELHGKKKDTPTMGGILILASMVISLFLWMDLDHVFTWILLITTVSLGLLGGFDDYLKLRYQNSKGVSSKTKMLVQLSFGVLLALYLLWERPAEESKFSPFAKEVVFEEKGKETLLSTDAYMERFYVPFCKKPLLLPTWVAFCLIVFVVAGASNGVNLTDGLDGLAAGCLVMVAFVLALVAFLSNHIEMARYLRILYIEGSGEIAIYLMALAGACLGFLWYNGYPAQIFMGDTGSLALGGVLGVSSVLLRRELLLGIAGMIFVLEALSVILQVLSYRYRNKRRVFLCAPLHHHFEYKGWPETKVVLRFWILSLLFAILAVVSLKLQ